MYNKIILVGNLTRDIELRFTQSGAGVAKSAIATSHKYTSNGEKKEEVCFTDISFFGKSAEIANQYLRKGSKILVEGRLKLEQWTDKNNQKRSKHSVVVETMKMLDSKNDNQSNNNQTNYQQPQQQAPQVQYQNQQGKPVTQNQYNQNQQQAQPQQPPVIDVDADSLPF